MFLVTNLPVVWIGEKEKQTNQLVNKKVKVKTEYNLIF